VLGFSQALFGGAGLEIACKKSRLHSFKLTKQWKSVSFPGKDHQNGGFSVAQSECRRVMNRFVDDVDIAGTVFLQYFLFVRAL